jgi:hypothetical protein
MTVPNGHVIVVGDDRVGVCVLGERVALGVPVRAVAATADAPLARAARAARVPLVVGDPQNAETLRRAGIADARACGLLANARPGQPARGARAGGAGAAGWVVLRLLNTSLAGAVSALAAPAFVAAILGRRATAVLPIGRDVMQVVGFTAERATDIGSLQRDCEARVLAVPGKEFPEPGVRVAPGDELMVIDTGRGLAELERRAVLSALTADTAHEPGAQA